MPFQIKHFCIKSHHSSGGWGNGYVIIPPGHPLYKVAEDNLGFLKVHGGITFSALGMDISDEYRGKLNINPSDWMIGFDTQKSFDNSNDQNQLYVMAQALNLVRQVRVYGCLRPQLGTKVA